MNEQLMTIVLESLAFFELADDEIIDPDAATDQTEGITHTLSQLSPDEKKALANYARQYAADEETAKGPPERIDFFRSLPANLELE